MSMMLAEELDVDYRSIALRGCAHDARVLLAIIPRIPDSRIRDHG